jgi:hypothetical protein
METEEVVNHSYRLSFTAAGITISRHDRRSQSFSNIKNPEISVSFNVEERNDTLARIKSVEIINDHLRKLPYWVGTNYLFSDLTEEGIRKLIRIKDVKLEYVNALTIKKIDLLSLDISLKLPETIPFCELANTG